MVKVNRFGKILHFIKGFGLMINLTEEEEWSAPTEMSTKATSKVVNSVVKEFLHVLTDLLIQVNGLMIYNMDSAFLKMRMDQPTRGNLQKGWNMEEEKLNGGMEIFMMGSSGKILLKVEASWHIPTGRNTMESGERA